MILINTLKQKSGRAFWFFERFHDPAIMHLTLQSVMCHWAFVCFFSSYMDHWEFLFTRNNAPASPLWLIEDISKRKYIFTDIYAHAVSGKWPNIYLLIPLFSKHRTKKTMEPLHIVIFMFWSFCFCFYIRLKEKTSN